MIFVDKNSRKSTRLPIVIRSSWGISDELFRPKTDKRDGFGLLNLQSRDLPGKLMYRIKRLKFY